MHLTYHIYDVFTFQKFTGNPLAIVLLPISAPPLNSTQRQKIATEFNLSETVFLSLPPPSSTPTIELQLYIHTSAREINFAGHPTIGSASYLLKTLGMQITTLLTRAGRIAISLDAKSGVVSASIPQKFHVHGLPYQSPSNVDQEGQQHPVVSIVKGMSWILVGLPDLAGLGRASTNLNEGAYEVGRLDEGWREGLCGTLYFVSVGGDENGKRERYRTRMFGSREDPGTGSASCALACWLATRGGGEGKRGRYLFEQGVEMGRRNEISVEVGVEGGEVLEVVLSGKAVRVMEGKVDIDDL